MEEVGGSDGGWWWGRPAPLDTGFRRYDGGEVRRPWALVRGGGSCLRGKTLRQAQGERFPKRAYRVWESGMRMVGGGGVPSPSPVWVRAFAGMTRAGGPWTGSGRAELRIAPTTGGLGARVSQSWAVVGRPPALAPRVLRPPFPPSISLRANGLPGPAPLDTGFRRYGGGECAGR